MRATMINPGAKIIFVMLLVFTVFFSCTGIAGEEGDVDWYSYKDGMEALESGDKTGFLHFYTDWCGYCKKIDDETFSSKNISDYLNDNFIPIKVDAEAERDVAGQYGANQFPLNIFLSADAEVIAGRPGFIPPDQMIDILKYIHTESFESMSFMDFLEKQ